MSDLGIGESVRARAWRGTLLVFVQFGGAQVLRLASNLLLTRLLFPEAFGLMALVQVFLNGLNLFSDTGVRPLIVQSGRGDDPDFLNTIWTVQVARGLLLWLLTLAIAGPAAALYEAPDIALILPVSGLALLVNGFVPTALHTAHRHLRLGQVTAIQLGCQALTLVIMAVLAVTLRSVWALVIGTLIGEVIRTLAWWIFLPDAKNRFRLERAALGNAFGFGRYIFIGTAAGFVIAQGDRAILGAHLSLGELGVYNVAFFLASVPLLLTRAVSSKIVLPLYRVRPMSGDPSGRAAIFRARRMLTAAALLAAAVMAFGGPLIVDLLYDPRFADAGPTLSLYALTLVPPLALNSVGSLLLAEGDSARNAVLQIVTAVLQTGLMFAGIDLAGVVGAIAAIGLAVLLTLPMRVAYARRYNAWDPVQDVWMTLAGLAICAAGVAINWDRIAPLLP
ncbi:oligosaccharide flippase family protein [Tropicimonas sediminicola]|uniref:Membrane protein involved in the export of O-antigen and teichoic acid n=1 Tax=Tropicimonas sediminicola TaxID=1031541 RepID=A0A239HA16_9RHOB|nr:oligosaccharide flippase family protein [Tropicimonas sediminicola]SNS77898.1 Membrane protein involved in the export of O-antigen and teichoic acid [Tropicimonas sediminicola]